MPQPATIVKAQLLETYLDETGAVTLGSATGGSGKSMTVQFNPESLTVSYTRADVGDTGRSNQAGTPAKSTLSVVLIFDITALGSGGSASSVQDLTSQVAYFVEPQTNAPWSQPGVRFLWGQFLFDGFMTSLTETLEFFSQDGTPLRARLSITLSNNLAQAKP